MIKSFSFYLVTALVIKCGSHFIKSSFLGTFLDSNVITILVTLLAINTTTMSVLLTKLKEISDKTGKSFTNTIPSLKHSRYEQIGLIILSLIFLILKKSDIVINSISHSSAICDVILTTAFIGGIYNLYDTGKSIFMIMEYDNSELK
jgi:hypothetical protein